MKRFSVTVFLFLTLTLTTMAYAAQEIWSARVISVHDGDTITVERSQLSYKLRLYGIDCPELSQDFGEQARDFAANMILGRDVIVYVRNVDMYGRHVAIVYADGISLNEKLLEFGFAWKYISFCKVKKICSKYSQLESAAKDTKIGLWYSDNAIPPWEYRKSRKHK